MKKYFIFPTPRQSMMLAVIFVILGSLLCFSGAKVLLNGVRLIGIILLVYGLYLLYLYFGKRASSNAAPLIQGIPLALIGLVISFSPGTLVSIFPMAIGMIVIFNAIMQMQKSFMLKDAHDTTWSVSFIIAVILMLAGLVLLLRPIQILNYLSKAAGICLIAEGIYMMMQAWQEQKYLQR